MKKNKFTDALRAAIEKHTGRGVVELKTYTDSVGAVAARAQVTPETAGANLEILDFLIIAQDVDKVTRGDDPGTWLEDCMFEAWPPKEGEPTYGGGLTASELVGALLK